MEPDTLSEVMERLRAAGYREDFHAEKDGLHASGHDCVHEPEAFAIDEVARFEGETNPDDEAILFALRCDEHGVKGTWAVAYGPAMPPDDAEMVRRLGPRRRETSRG